MVSGEDIELPVKFLKEVIDEVVKQDGGEDALAAVGIIVEPELPMQKGQPSEG
jgi:hypothetical protein